MKIKVLIDNIENDELAGEWGLAIYIEHNGKKILLDTGGSDLFLTNAEKMGVDIAAVDIAVLSHAHYDHSNGMAGFFAANSRASLFLQSCCCENCYAEKETGLEYIGIQSGWLERYRQRLSPVAGDSFRLGEGAVILPHSTEGLEAVGLKAKMYTKEADKLIPETFAHEQTLVLETKSGLAVFSSCSHAGVDNIIEEVRKAYPGKKICAYIGGMHLFKTADEEVLALAKRLKESGVEKIITGHCTGEQALGLLKDVLGDRLIAMHSGLEVEID